MLCTLYIYALMAFCNGSTNLEAHTSPNSHTLVQITEEYFVIRFEFMTFCLCSHLKVYDEGHSEGIDNLIARKSTQTSTSPSLTFFRTKWTKLTHFKISILHQHYHNK